MAPSIKLFVALGTQKFPFDRLVKAINGLIESGDYKPEEIVLQSMRNDVKPLCTNLGIIPHDQFNKWMSEAEVVIVHAGVNSILSCMSMNKPFIIVPRNKKFGEHVDYHQFEIARLMETKFNVLVLRDVKDLKNKIEEAKTHQYRSWVSQKAGLIESLKKDIK